MDGNDAASYVEDLVGDNANIIFGAKYDETMTDEATVTVIATGLEESAGAQPGKIMPKMQYQNMGSVTRPVGTAPINRTATTTATGFGAMPHQQPVHQQPMQQTTPSFSGIQKPKQPESSVQPVDIKIPDFLKNSRK